MSENLPRPIAPADDSEPYIPMGGGLRKAGGVHRLFCGYSLRCFPCSTHKSSQSTFYSFILVISEERLMQWPNIKNRLRRIHPTYPTNPTQNHPFLKVSHSEQSCLRICRGRSTTVQHRGFGTPSLRRLVASPGNKNQMKGPRCGLVMIERTSPRAWHFAQMDESPVRECQFQRDRAPSAYFSSGFRSSHMHKRQSELHQTKTCGRALTHSLNHTFQWGVGCERRVGYEDFLRLFIDMFPC